MEPTRCCECKHANIPMPTAEERAEMRALDDKLDAFAKLLKAERQKCLEQG